MVEITGRYVDVQGCRAYYETSGSGKPVLFLAPAGRESSHWAEFLTGLGETYLTVALDLPGHGKSGLHPAGDYLRDVDAIVDFVASFMSAISEDDFAVVGCSLGGSLAYAAASMLSKRVHAIAALEGTDYSPVISDARLMMLEHPRVNHVEYLADNVLGLTGSAASEAARAFLTKSLANVNALALQADLEAYGGIDLRADTPQIVCPVLSVRGTQDWIVSEDQTQGTLSRLTGTTTVEHHDLEGVGHWPHVEAPDRLIPLLQRFLDRHY